MSNAEPPKPKPLPVQKPQVAAQVIELRPAIDQPDDLSAADALRVVRMIAADTDNIIVIGYGRRRAQQRRKTRRQMELCVQKGTITEGPFLNGHGNWQVNLYRHAAGEELTCVVAIEWATKVLIINTF
jgi:hypothetical protein